jgi:hypothetical protein
MSEEVTVDLIQMVYDEVSSALLQAKRAVKNHDLEKKREVLALKHECLEDADVVTHEFQSNPVFHQKAKVALAEEEKRFQALEKAYSDRIQQCEVLSKEALDATTQIYAEVRLYVENLKQNCRELESIEDANMPEPFRSRLARNTRRLDEVKAKKAVMEQERKIKQEMHELMKEVNQNERLVLDDKVIKQIQKIKYDAEKKQLEEVWKAWGV